MGGYYFAGLIDKGFIESYTGQNLPCHRRAFHLLQIAGR